MQYEALLTQFGYAISPSTLAQIERVVTNTIGFEQVEKHLLALHDALQVHHSFVSLSNNQDYFKIKNEALGEAMIDEVNEIIAKWSEKYKISLEKVINKNTYYVIGYKA